MAAFTGGTEQQYLISVNINGVTLGTFDKHTGGDATADVSMYRPGGMGPQQAYQALPVYSDLTATRAYIEDRDHELFASLLPQTGRVTMSVAVQPLDDEGNPYLSPIIYTGRFSDLKDSGTDSQSTKVRTWDVTMKIENVS